MGARAPCYGTGSCPPAAQGQQRSSRFIVSCVPRQNPWRRYASVENSEQLGVNMQTDGKHGDTIIW